MHLTDAKKIKEILEKTGKNKGEKSRDLTHRMEIYRWLLKNGMNKADIDEAKTKILM